MSRVPSIEGVVAWDAKDRIENDSEMVPLLFFIIELETFTSNTTIHEVHETCSLKI